MAGLPPFEVETTTIGAITSVVGDDSMVDSVTAISVLLILAYLARAAFPTFFTSLLDDQMLSAIGMSKPDNSQKSRADLELEDEWWHFPVHLLTLWQLRNSAHQEACARRLVCDHVTAGRPDPFFDFAIGGVAYMMGASGSLSMVDKLQSLKEGPVDCSRLVPECDTIKLREAKGLGTTIQKLTDMLYDWMGW